MAPPPPRARRRTLVRGLAAAGLLLGAWLRQGAWGPPGCLPPSSPSAAAAPKVLPRPALLRAAAAAAAAAAAPGQAPPARALFGIADVPPPPDVAAPPADAQVTASGVAFKVLRPPDCAGEACERPLPFDKVEVDYTGWQTSGRMFDSSVQRGQHATFGVSQVIKGWTEGLQLMALGEKRRFWIPAKLAYGENPGNGRPGGMLVFDVELYAIQRGPKPPPAPADLAAPPSDATVAASGLVWKQLSPGKPGFESRRPGPETRVTVEYSGWKADGELIISTQVSGKPAKFMVKDIRIKGLAEGIQLMTLGESRRFWLKPELAYGASPSGGLPGGMLVFDVKLVGFE